MHKIYLGIPGINRRLKDQNNMEKERETVENMIIDPETEKEE